MIGYTREVGRGPWTQLGDEVQRLQVLNDMGQFRQVLADVQRLRDDLQNLPDTAGRGPNESSFPWEVREVLLDTGAHAAFRLGRWEDALSLNAERAASMRDRRAPAADIARVKVNDHGPLLELGQADEALELLRDCLQVFQDARDIRALGMTLGALADTENRRGRGDAAIRLQRDALRHAYLAGGVPTIAECYYNLGVYLRRHVRQPALALTSHLTTAFIYELTGTDVDRADVAVQGAATVLYEFGADATPPVSVATLCLQIGDIPGTDPAGLIMRLSRDAKTAERTLRDLIAPATEMANWWRRKK
jgi:tetratricopeptide (TPR) repeat protein